MAKDRTWYLVEQDGIFLEQRVGARPAYVPHDAAYWRPPDAQLAGTCLVAGIAVAFLYVWTVLMGLSILGAGPPDRWYWFSLAATAALTATAFYAYESWERRYWQRNWKRVSEFADPAPWK
jgi:hypothetical protein